MNGNCIFSIIDYNNIKLEKSDRMKQFISRILVFVLFVGAILFGQINTSFAQEFDGEKVSVGVVGDLGLEIWEFVAEKALEQGIEIDLILLTDYNTPNQSLQDGSLDLNAYQHVAFLNDWNEANKGDLENIGFTFVTEMGIFSEKYDSLKALPKNAKIAIPNDPTNGGRAILALELAGLIEVDDAAGILATVDNITENPNNIEIVELEAHQIAQALPDVDAGIIGTGLATDAGLKIDQALFVDTEDISKLDKAYRNIIAARSEDKENPLYLKIVEIFQTDEVAEVIKKVSNGGAIPAWD